MGISEMKAEKVDEGGGEVQSGCRAGQKAAGFQTHWSFRQNSSRWEVMKPWMRASAVRDRRL